MVIGSSWTRILRDEAASVKNVKNLSSGEFPRDTLILKVSETEPTDFDNVIYLNDGESVTLGRCTAWVKSSSGADLSVVATPTAVGGPSIKDFAQRSGFVTVFGEQVVGSRQNNINIPFIRNNGNIGDTDYLKTTTFTSSGTGVQVHENETAYVGSGTGVGSSTVRSKALNRYITGHSNEVFHTMVFDGSETGVDSGVGYGDADKDFIGFGYNGTVFGIWLVLRGVKVHIPQQDWNENTLMEGDFVLDPQKENISGTSFGWLGVADILFYINASDNDWYLVHRHKTANIDTKPHLTNPTQPVSEWVKRAAGSGSNIRVGTSSWYAGTVGNRATGTGADKTPLVERDSVAIPASTETVLVSLKNKLTFAGKDNSVRIRYGTLTLVSDGNKSVKFKVYINGVTGGTWDDYDSSLSVTEVATDTVLNLTTSTVGGIVKIAEQVGSTALGKSDRDRINLFDSDIVIAAYPGDIITITAESQNTTDIDIQLRWIEEF